MPVANLILQLFERLTNGPGLFIVATGFGHVSRLLRAFAEVMQVAGVELLHLVARRAKASSAVTAALRADLCGAAGLLPMSSSSEASCVSTRGAHFGAAFMSGRACSSRVCFNHASRSSACCSTGVWPPASIGLASLSADPLVFLPALYCSSSLRCTSRSRTGAAARRILLSRRSQRCAVLPGRSFGDSSFAEDFRQ